ncbi:MAG TPA: hypothetical protein VGE01_07295 [Fimbriimonas sp.]
MWFLFLLLPTFAQAAPNVLKFKPKVGSTAQYRLVLNQTEVGADGKLKEKISSQTPVSLRFSSGNALRTEVGPLFTLGRSVGRAKIRETMMPNGTVAPTAFFVTLPTSGVKPGQKWTGVLNVPPPIPANLQANYRYVGPSKDGRFAEVAMAVAMPGSTKLSGNGQFFVRLSDGVLDHGNAKFDIAYLRPDQKDRSKMLVNSRVKIDYKILPK